MMKFIKPYQKFNEELIDDKRYSCPVCGSYLYLTHTGGIGDNGTKVTLQCSSDEARFWDFNRGTLDQKKAHEHFMKSITYISMEEYLQIKK